MDIRFVLYSLQIMKLKKTLVIGASTNPSRYSYKAVHKLMEHGHPVIPVGIKKGAVNGLEIERPGKVYADIDTITLYVGPLHQPELYDFIFSNHPKRIIFNPGTENEELISMAQDKGIQTEIACTLVLLSIGDY